MYIIHVHVASTHTVYSVHVAFGLDFYTDVLDLRYLLEHLSSNPFFAKYKKLNEALVGLVEDYSLVTFVPLNVEVSPELCIVIRYNT